jgi:glycosyltransferase involved in cell wall biosynthesis
MQQLVLDMDVVPEKVHIIPNWINEETIKPISPTKNSFRIQSGWQDKFVVLYSGNLGVAHDFDDILEVSRCLQDCRDIVFAFIGRGQRLAEIEQHIAAHRSNNVILLPFQEQTTLAHSLGAGDLHFISLRTGFEGLVVPSKVYGALAAGRPILYQGGHQSEIARLVEEEDVGTVVSPGDVDALQRAVLAYRNSPMLCARQGKRARSLAEGYYSYTQACFRYARALDVNIAPNLPG